MNIAAVGFRRSATYDNEVNNLDRVLGDHELLTGLEAATALEERRRALQRFPTAIANQPEVIRAGYYVVCREVRGKKSDAR